MTATRQLTAAELQAGLAASGPQGSPYIGHRNLTNLRAAMSNVPRDILAEALADMLAAKYGKTRASMVLRDAVQIVETGK